MDEKNGLDKLSTKILALAILGVLIVLTVFLGIAVLRPNTSNASAQAGFIPENTPTSSAASYTETQHVHDWRPANYNAPQWCLSCGVSQGSPKQPVSPLGLRDIIESAMASSEYSGDNLGAHTVHKVYDGRLDTNWTENVSGTGVGEWLAFVFNGTYAFNQIKIHIGSHYNEAVYAQNCRPKTMTLYFSDGSYETIYLADTYSEQVITLSKFYYTSMVQVVIDDVYMGTKYQDTVIAEMDFVAYHP